MPKVDIPQISFGGGVISDHVFSRVDLQKFGSSLAQADNYFVHSEGGISNRSGLEFIAEVEDSDHISRLIPFQFNEEQTYVLEFSQERMNVLANGGFVLGEGVEILEVNSIITLLGFYLTTIITSQIQGDPYLVQDWST